MKPERFRWLAAVVYAHPDHRLVGRTRLQKVMWLLQRLELPSDYDFRMHHYGPYSDGIQGDINLLNRMDFVQETPVRSQEGNSYSIFSSEEDAKMDEVEKYRDDIDRMSEEDPTILELAATYDAFRELGCNDQRALAEVHRKKGSKCDEGRMEKAIKLLFDLNLQTTSS